MRRLTQSADARSFRRGTRNAALERVILLRMFIAPFLATLALTFAFFEPTLWRRGVLATVIAVLLVLSTVEFARARRHGLDAIGVPFNMFAMNLGQLSIVVCTGGLFSPVVVAMVAMSFLGALLFQERGLVTGLLVLALTALFSMAFVHSRWSLMPVIFGSATELESGPAPWILASMYSLMAIAASRAGGILRGVFEGLYTDAVEEREERLRMHAEQNLALSTLSAEIAHELKNPLASVKGLSALVAKDVDGKTEERVGVLRREVGRMQAILDEFLNFSRPLVPLSMEELDARALVEDVLRLHEGSAIDRGVDLSVDAAPASLSCDPRKVRQILINLVQNALEASEAGGRVTVRVVSGDPVIINVDDEGAGLDEDLSDRLFDAGVTTKETGSGIGLVVARSLARQHGGELELANRDGGGCRATLQLPRRPEVEA